MGVVPILNNSNRNIYSSITYTTDINDKCEQKYIYKYTRSILKYLLIRKGLVTEARKKLISSISNWQIVTMLVY